MMASRSGGRIEPMRRARPRGGLIVMQEIFGVNSHIRAVCDAFAADGYVAIAPALFDRYESNVDIGYSAEDVARGRALKARASTDAALRDIAAARDAVASAGRVGIVGYCWGGFIAWMSAARVSGLACAISYYGGGMPAALAEQPRCPVCAHFGERDAAIPLAGVKQFAAAHPESKSISIPPNTASTTINAAVTTRLRRGWRATYAGVPAPARRLRRPPPDWTSRDES